MYAWVLNRNQFACKYQLDKWWIKWLVECFVNSVDVEVRWLIVGGRSIRKTLPSKPICLINFFSKFNTKFNTTQSINVKMIEIYSNFVDVQLRSLNIIIQSHINIVCHWSRTWNSKIKSNLFEVYFEFNLCDNSPWPWQMKITDKLVAS